MDIQALHRFIRQLEKLKFPKISIAMAYTAGGSLASGEMGVNIIDPLTKDILYTFLFAEPAAYTKDGEDHPAAPVKSRRSAAMYTYSVTEENRDDFVLHLVEKANPKLVLSGQRVKLGDLPPAYTLSNASRAGVIKDQEQASRTPVDSFKTACYVCTIIALALGFLDYFKLLTLTVTQYAILGVSFALFILPQAKTMSILGMQFERQFPASDDDGTKPDSPIDPILNDDMLKSLKEMRISLGSDKEFLTRIQTAVSEPSGSHTPEA